jgi:hypothetical protein
MKGLAVLAIVLVLGAPVAAHAAPVPGATTNEIPGLRRTNQVLSALIAFLKLCDELSQLPDPGGSTPLPPPIGTGHPGPLPGPLPCTTPLEGAM